MLEIIDRRPSPNFDDRPEGTCIDTIIIHYTEMDSFESAYDRLCSLDARVSAHFLISKQGYVFKLVEETKRAWHAGESYWGGRTNINHNSIGIELDNNGSEEYSKLQIKSLILLCKILLQKFPIRHDLILGHSDIAPYRKVDPGPFFDWYELNRSGIGIMPKNNFTTLAKINNDIIALQNGLKSIGYDVEISGVYDTKTCEVTKAYCDHFMPINKKYENTSHLLESIEQLLLEKEINK